MSTRRDYVESVGNVKFEKDKDGFSFEASGLVGLVMGGAIIAYIYLRYGHPVVKRNVTNAVKKIRRKG